jgi:hypothetical protein
LPTHVFEGDLTLADKVASDYVYLPFPVPPGASRLTVRYDYSNRMDAAENWGGNVLDIGLFGPGGLAPGQADFRGWSGSFRSSFFLAPDQATPGYFPGLPPGQWHVVLGLYQMARNGCHYRVEVEVLVSSPQSSLPSPSDLVPHTSSLVPHPSDFGLRTSDSGLGTWYRGDLHCHTRHSDGENTIAELIASARARGLDFLAITDHNTTSYFQDLPTVADAGLLLIPGEELTTYYGHANVWGIRQWVDFRGRSSADLARAAAEAHRQGALISVNHPKQEGPAWELPTDFDFDAVEVWQSHWWVSNYQSLAWWERRLRAGRRVSAVGGSDLHRLGTAERPAPYELGTPCTWVFSHSLTEAAILDGIRAGHVFLSRAAGGPQITFTARYADGQVMAGDVVQVSPGTRLTLQTQVRGAQGDLVRLVSAHGVLVLVEITADDFTHEFAVTPVADGYYYPQVIQPPEADLDKEPSTLMVDALANPIYVLIADG